MAIPLNNDEKTHILLHYKSLFMKMCTVQCEYQTVRKLTNAFLELIKTMFRILGKCFLNGTLDSQSESGHPAVEKE